MEINHHPPDVLEIWSAETGHRPVTQPLPDSPAEPDPSGTLPKDPSGPTLPARKIRRRGRRLGARLAPPPTELDRGTNYRIYWYTRPTQRPTDRPFRRHLGRPGNHLALCGLKVRSPLTGLIRPYYAMTGEVQVLMPGQLGAIGNSIFCSSCLTQAYRTLEESR